jgi:hypothetical protein
MWSGRTYFFVTDAITWTAARTYCTRFGYQLATVESAAENGWLTATARSTLSADAWWIGLAAFGGGDTWGWADGSPAAYRNWAPGEPNHTTTNACVQLMMQTALTRNHYPPMTPEGAWNDTGCSGEGVLASGPAICRK